jgi:hypothetical protein
LGAVAQSLTCSMAFVVFVVFVLFVPFVLFALDRNGGVAEALGRVQRASTQGAPKRYRQGPPIY